MMFRALRCRVTTADTVGRLAFFFCLRYCAASEAAKGEHGWRRAVKITLRVRQKREQHAVTGMNERARRLGGAFVQSAPNGAGSGPPRESAMRLQLAALECRRRSSWRVEPSRSGSKAAAGRLPLQRCPRS
ncbi:hypothetical protein MRX96_005615 [Rhipicephalus microplus]